MFYYVYILRSRMKQKIYIGFTTDLKKRLKSHNRGLNFATAPYKPWKLIFYEAYRNKYDALRRENYLKSTKGRTTIKSMLKEYFKQIEKIVKNDPIA